MSYAISGKILSILPMKDIYLIRMETELGNYELKANVNMLYSIWKSFGKRVTGDYSLEKLSRQLIGKKMIIEINF
jgi:hypothetical protein